MEDGLGHAAADLQSALNINFQQELSSQGQVFSALPWASCHQP